MSEMASKTLWLAVLPGHSYFGELMDNNDEMTQGRFAKYLEVKNG